MNTILIIDDEEKIRDAYKRFLTDEGFRVILAKDATEGTRALIRNDAIHLVLLDINMYAIDGGMMKEIINEYNRHLKVIVSSVRPLDEQRQLIPDAFDYFDKSHGMDLLLVKVHNALLQPH